MSKCKKVRTEKIVLIGGSLDKKVITIDEADSTYVRMQILDTAASSESQVYRIANIRGSFKYKKVGIHNDITIDEAVDLLVEAYKNGE